MENNRSCHAIGKIADIFSNRGISTSVSGLSDDALFYKMIDVIKKAKNGDLIFANFVEFDSLYGHRRDVAGFAAALERFDLKLVKLLEIINPNDFLIITADHGNDPTFKGTDHTREKVPVLMVGNYAQKGNNGNIVFSDVGATMAAFLNLSGKLKGTNIFNDNNKLEKKMQNLKIVDHPLVQHKLTKMRKKDTPTNHFRQLLREISLLLAYEITRNLDMTTVNIETPIENFEAPTLDGKKLALVSILRAGNGLLDGVLDLIPSARVGYVGLYRDEKTLEPVQYYFKVPNELSERVVITLDPMLATGNSACAAIDLLKKAGAKTIRFLCLLAAPEGVKTLNEAHPDVPIITASLDRQLNDIGYIMPGLGDAGDRMFGTK